MTKANTDTKKKRSNGLEVIKQIVPGLAATLGPSSEVVLHDLSDPEHSIIAITGDITHRKQGGPVTDLVLRLLRSKTVGKDVINYENTTKDGRRLRSSTIFIREGDEVIGCLCINIDLTDPLMALQFLQDYCTTTRLGKNTSEVFSTDVYDMLSRVMDDTIAKIGIPVVKMVRHNKLNVVKMLDEKGFFMIKGAIDYAAEVLKVSRYTIYNYLNQIRMKARSENRNEESSG